MVVHNDETAAAEVRLKVDEGVAVLTLDRPQVKNALGWATWRDLDAAIRAVAVDSSVRAVVLTGSGGVFSSGGDVKTQGGGGGGAGLMAPAARLRLGQEVLKNLYALPQPTVAAVDGYAVGVGWSIALSCDFIIAADDAFFWAPFTERALLPDGGLGWLLTRRVGHGRAVDVIIRGRRLTAEEARDWGLVTEICSPGNALNAAMSLAAQLVELPADTIAGTKRLLRQAPALTHEQYLHLEETSVALNFRSPDVLQGRQAFIERRQPVFNRHLDQ